MATLADVGPDRGGEGNVAAEGAALVELHGRHALVAARAGVGVGRLADPRLLGVLELAALADGEEVEAGGGEARAEVDGVVEPAAAFDDLVPQEADTDGPIGTEALPDGGVDLEG